MPIFPRHGELKTGQGDADASPCPVLVVENES